MSFQDWIEEDPDAHGEKRAGRTDGAGQAEDFTHAARQRAQAERESNRLRRRHRWRVRAVVLRRTSSRTGAGGQKAERNT